MNQAWQKQLCDAKMKQFRVLLRSKNWTWYSQHESSIDSSESALKYEDFVGTLSLASMLTLIHTLKELLSDPSEQSRPRRVVMSLFFDRFFSVVCCVAYSSLIFRWLSVSLTKRQRQHAALEQATELWWCWVVLSSLVWTTERVSLAKYYFSKPILMWLSGLLTSSVLTDIFIGVVCCLVVLSDLLVRGLKSRILCRNSHNLSTPTRSKQATKDSSYCIYAVHLSIK